METKICRVKIVKGDQQFEVEGDQDFVVRMLERYGFTSYTTFSQGGLTLKEDQASYPSKQITPWEFVRRLDLQKKTDMILGFVYYLEKYNGKSEFSLADIKNLYYESRLETTNIGIAITQNVKRGYIAQVKPRNSKTKLAYRLTRTGENYIQKVSDTFD